MVRFNVIIFHGSENDGNEGAAGIGLNDVSGFGTLTDGRVGVGIVGRVGRVGVGIVGRVGVGIVGRVGRVGVGIVGRVGAAGAEIGLILGNENS